MNTIFYLLIFSTICFSQNIEEELFIRENTNNIFTTFVIDHDNTVSLFNWYIINDNIYYKYFSYVNIDYELNIKMVKDTNFQLENYSDVIKVDNKYYIADNNVSTGKTRILEFDGDNVSLVKEISEEIKFKNSFFHNDLMFSTIHDNIYKNPDSLHVKFYISNLEGEFLDSVIYKGLKRDPGPNFYFRHNRPFRENGNTYILGAKGVSFLKEYNSFVIKFNEQNEIEFFNELEKQQDSLVPTGTSIIKYFDKYLIMGFEEDRKKELIYSFIKVFDSDFNELNHYRYDLFPECYFNELIVNDDSTLSVYGKRRYDKVHDEYKPLYVKIDKNFEVENYKVYYEDDQEKASGFHYAVSRENFDIVIGFKEEYLYIAKFDKTQLKVKNEIKDYFAKYDIYTNTLQFENNIPTNIEVIDLLGRSIFATKDIRKTIQLPELPNNQIIFLKLTYNNNTILQRIK